MQLITYYHFLIIIVNIDMFHAQTSQSY